MPNLKLFSEIINREQHFHIVDMNKDASDHELNDTIWDGFEFKQYHTKGAIYDDRCEVKGIVIKSTYLDYVLNTNRLISRQAAENYIARLISYGLPIEITNNGDFVEKQFKTETTPFEVKDIVNKALATFISYTEHDYNEYLQDIAKITRDVVLTNSDKSVEILIEIISALIDSRKRLSELGVDNETLKLLLKL